MKVLRDPALGDDAVARMENVIGQSIFERIWVSAPSSTEAADGLGPMFNARSCAACHPGGAHGTLVNKDGSLSPSLLVRLGARKDGAADPVYGRQLQTEAARGVPREGGFTLDDALSQTKLADGTIVTLRRPTVTLHDMAAGPLAPDTVTGLRLAPAIHGMGPLDSIPAKAIMALADPDDKDGDGVSGRVHWLDAEQKTFGRFGWKAIMPSLEAQNSHAFFADMGLSTPLFPDAYGECTARQTACRAAPSGASPQFEDLEVTSTLVKVLDRFVAEAVLPAGPKPLADAATLEKGRAVFAAAGCQACHHPGYDIEWPKGAAMKRHISPYTDLLLHDMGDGLAEDLIEDQAEGREWRTAPLWGLRWAVDHQGQGALLHDGRARNILEAILWHGGEALPARDHVANLSANDRQALISFLSSL
ncbi:MAG: hypothetical protein HYU58_04825 [Proteobacteria bacterium]|nr:hypothetical protein [Pseudomonadota bacterium]